MENNFNHSRRCGSYGEMIVIVMKGNIVMFLSTSALNKHNYCEL